MKRRARKKRQLHSRWHRWFLFASIVFAAVTVVYCSSREHRMDPMMNVVSERKAKRVEPIVGEDFPVIDFKNAFFDFDKSELKPEGKKALLPAAEWLKKNPRVNIQIEGYCDERGSDPYNLALGEKRAQATKAFLVSQGVGPERIATVSYGRVEGSSASIRAQNRRAGIVVIYPESE